MLYFFYGEECPHCHEVMPIVDKLIAEGLPIEKLETWHSDENAKKYEEVECGKCGGVPFFINTDTCDFICGEATEERIRAWAIGE